MKKKTSIMLIVAALFTAIAVPAWASGIMSTKMMDTYMDSIYENDTAVIADFSKAADMTVVTEDTQITLPDTGEEAIVISREMDNSVFDMQIMLPSANENIALLADKAVYKENGYTQAVQVADNDIHIVTSVLNDEAQSEFAYGFDLPVGAYMEYADYGTDNSVLIYNEEGQAIYTLVPGIAKDANGKEVEFVWNLQGDALIYGIAEGQELAYPVNISVNAVAAYGFRHYFTDWEVWSYITVKKPGTNDIAYQGWSLGLKPDLNNLYTIGTPPGYDSHRSASWAAVCNECESSPHWNNPNSVKSQYFCHYDNCVNIKNGCESWDLETGCSGMASLAGNKCNPCLN